MNLIFTKNIELQDAKYRLVSNNNNETSIFIPKDNGEAIGLQHDEEFTFYLNKENVLYTLFNTFNYSLDHTIFEKRDSVRIDYNKVVDIVDILKPLPDLFAYKVKVSVNGNRFYLKELRQENKFNIRDIIIGRLYEFNFYKNSENKIECKINYKGINFDNNTNEEINSQSDKLKVNLISPFAKWLNANPKSNYYENNYDKTINGLERINDKYKDSFKDDLFVIDINEIDSRIKSINTNIWNKDSDFWAFSDATSTHMPRAILNKDNYQKFLKEYELTNQNSFNKIYFGPPGTGKSHAIKEELKKLNVKADNYSRVTFHPDYDYHSFVGGYKPFTDKEDDDKIKYKFVPQVFTDLYVKAWSSKSENYYLVIEEINRGNCAEIFGDIFQLLDRNPEYNIEPSSELKAYLKDMQSKINEDITEEDTKVNLLFDGKLQMPNNLSILASMNTSDQSLYPMDSAFKRRWDWHYVPIDLKCIESNFTIIIDDTHQYSWLEFLAKVNDKIYSVTKSEDKQLGNWFINASKSENSISKELFINKVLFYLWNDVFKDEVFNPDNIFIERNTDGTKNRDISFNNFYNKDEQDRLLIHLLSDILNVPIIKSEDKEIVEYSQENQVENQAAEPKAEEYKENKSESEE